MSDQVVQSHWDEHVGWSKTADRLKKRVVVARTITLLLTIAGAALGTLAAAADAEPLRTVAGMAGTVALTLVPFIAHHFLTPEETRKWLRSRSVSEGIKSEVYAFRAGADPYTDASALQTLQKKVREIRSYAENLETERAATGSPTEQAPLALDTAGYLEGRVNEQIVNYYRKNAKTNASRAIQFRWAEIILAGVAAILSGVATFFGGVDPQAAEGSASAGELAGWVAVLTTIGASIATHAAASRYEFQATTYFATARQLEDLARDWASSGATAPSPEWSAFVRACEEAISAENRSWMAKLDKNS